MSLVRLALRLGAVLALTNNNTAPWPTLAQGRVFDTRLNPAQLGHKRAGDRLPYIVVRTDHDQGEGLSENNGGPPWRRHIDLTLELAVSGFMQVEGEDGEPIDVVGTYECDPEIEAALDVLEDQTRRALFGAGTWAALFQNLLNRGPDRVDSVVFHDPENAAIKFATRMLTFKCQVNDEFLADGIAILMPGQTAPAPVLPPPIQEIVDAVEDAGTENPYVDQLVDIITTAGLPTVPALPALLKIRLVEAEQAEENLAGTPRGPRPDGVAEVRLPATSPWWWSGALLDLDFANGRYYWTGLERTSDDFDLWQGVDIALDQGLRTVAVRGVRLAVSKFLTGTACTLAVSVTPGAVPPPATEALAQLWDGDNSDSIYWQHTAGGLLQVVTRNASVNSMATGTALTSNTRTGAAARVAANDGAVSFAGAAALTDAAVTLPATLTELAIGSTHTRVRRVVILPPAVNATVQALAAAMAAH